jgi:hypothetical protein
MDQFQLFFRDRPAGPVRGSWEEAARDAVAAGLATWVHECPLKAISWAGAGQASIARMPTRFRGARHNSIRDACVRFGRRARTLGKPGVIAPGMIGSPLLPAFARTC